VTTADPSIATESNYSVTVREMDKAAEMLMKMMTSTN
jgi:hypothetical protein